jgi:hypothetical protein
MAEDETRDFAGVEAFRQQMLELARANIALMDGTTDPIKRIIAVNEIVFAVWPEKRAPDGVGILIVKGTAQLARQAAAGPNIWFDVKIGAVPCSCHEEAVAIRNTFGDGEKTLLS